MALSEEEMAQYQRLSNDYVPEVEGPLVSPRQSCRNIVNEYAQAGVVYVHKTTDIALKFANYRTVRGDGNCGWRALAFGYFEALVHSADPQAPLAQIARLTSLNNLLDSVGYQRDIYEDFSHETIQLLRQIASTTPDHHDGAALLSSFNDPNVCNGIIMHFRLITSAWMKTRPQSFVPFMVGLSIDQYCGANIEPHAVEIDNIGLHACIQAILQPAGVAVQVLYLDQSDGEQVNEFNWPGEGPNPNAVTAYGGVPTVRLLYRPGHYDLLYKAEDLPLPARAAITDPQINFMSDPVLLPSNNHCYAPQQGLDLNHFYLPGFASAGISSMPFSTTAHSAGPAYASSGLPIVPPTTKAYSVSSYNSPPQDVKPVAPSPMLQGLSSTGGFRPSQYQLQLTDRISAPIQAEPCQTEAMKQAGESPAHFRNKQFQPYMWDPTAEYNASRNPPNHSEPNRRRSS